MKILLIGNFAPPYEEESLYNFSVLNSLRNDGNDCYVINISENPSKEDGIIDITGYFDYISKLISLARKKDVIHFMTKGYTRLGLLKLALSVLSSSLFRAKPVITFHSELLSIIGLTRSPFGGQQTMHFSFSRAHKIIFADRDTCEAASVYRTKDNFTIIPSFIPITEELKGNWPVAFKKLSNKKKVIVFSNVIYPSFLFDILKGLLSLSTHPDMGIVVSLSEKPSVKLQHVIEEFGGNWAESMVFIESDNIKMLTMAYTRANLVLRPLSCDGKVFFPGFTVSLKRPVRSDKFLYFPDSLLLLKEGDVAGLSSYIVNTILMEKTETPPDVSSEDFYSLIKKIYTT